MDTIRVTRADQGEHLLVITDVATIKASGRDTSGNLLVMEVTGGIPGGGPPVLHRHTSSETFRVLEGAFEVNTVDANNALSTVEVVAGDTISIPSMAWHTLKNVGVTPGRLVAHALA